MHLHPHTVLVFHKTPIHRLSVNLISAEVCQGQKEHVKCLVLYLREGGKSASESASN